MRRVLVLLITVVLRCHAYLPASASPSRWTRVPSSSPAQKAKCASYSPRRHFISIGNGALTPRRRSHSHPLMKMGSMNDNDDDGDENDSSSSIPVPLPLVGASLAAQPIVWTSLYFVITTGAGFPPGPFGLLGALEGVSYLIVVGIVGLSLYKKVTTGSGLPPGPNGLWGAAEGLSYLSLLGGLAALASLVGERGCVPNAKPILDYSAYLPVCDPESTGAPGLFGQ